MNSAINIQQPISVVIVNYNAGMLLTKCVSATLGQALQVIVVDNHSNDISLHELESNFPNEQHLQIIRLKSNTGFASGCNTGLSYCNLPYVLFLNPDCLLGKDSLQRMLAVLQSDDHIGMVGGYLTNPDGSEQGGGRRAIPTPWRAFVRAFGLYHLEKFWPTLFFDFHLNKQPLPDKPIDVEAISGALMLVKKTAVDDVGHWDEHYFLHCEDLDWCMRFQQKNWRIVFVPDAPVTHFQGTCSHARPYFVAWHKHKGMLRFYQKFFRDQYPSFLMGLITFAVWCRFAATVIFHTINQGRNFLKSHL